MSINMWIVMRSLWCVCVVVLFMVEVSLQKTVQAIVGSSAMLPCHSDNKQLEVLTAHWRFNDIKNVYDIQQGKGSAKEQDPQYKGRIEAFPQEFVKGNVSLRLVNLRHDDLGSYCCFIPYIAHQQCTQLQVTERPLEYQGEPRNHGAQTNTIVWHLIALFSINILFQI